MVGLNNRIYFREHALSVVSDNDVVDFQHRLEVASHHFHPVQIGTPTSATIIGNGFKLDRMSPHTVELAKVKEDIISVNSEP